MLHSPEASPSMPSMRLMALMMKTVRNGERDANPRRHGMDEQHSVKVGQFHSASHQHDAADYLDKELGTVAHTDKVIGNADKVQHDDGAEGVCQWQRFCAYFLKQLIMSG